MTVTACRAGVHRSRLLSDERPKGQKKPNDFLTQVEDQLLVAGPNTPEERIIINLLRCTGMRAGEAVSLSWKDLGAPTEAIGTKGDLLNDIRAHTTLPPDGTIPAIFTRGGGLLASRLSRRGVCTSRLVGRTREPSHYT